MKRGAVVAFAVAIGLGLAVPKAHASWPIWHLTNYYTLPSPAMDNLPTTLFLWGWFGYDDGIVTDAHLLDPTHIELTLRPGPDVPDTAHVWTQAFPLGLLAAGQHPMHVKITYVDTDQSVFVDEGDLTFEVVDNTFVPPPPEPTEPGSWLVRGLSGYSTDPVAPNITQPTTLHLWGWFPYDCGQVTNAQVIDASHLKLTLEPGATACNDTARVWSQSFALGLLAAGTHPITLELTAVGDPADSFVTTTRVASFSFGVTDSLTSPEPPPVDSLGTTPGQPNPFALRTSFKVSLAHASSIDVGIYDLAGRQVVSLHRGFAPAGDNVFAWDGRRSDGERAAGGVYFYRVAVQGKVVSRRLVLLPKP